MADDDKYIIHPKGDDESEEAGKAEGEEPSLEQYVFANSVVQTALIQLLVDKGVFNLDELTAQVDKVRQEM